MPAPRQGADAVTPGGVLTRRAASTPFEVHLDVFEGPFDLLLGLIAKHRLDVTEIALAEVTDEFLAHLRPPRQAGDELTADDEHGWDLGEASEFLLVAATLLDLKAARLLPQGTTADEEDLALIEARDLLFARLLQYRAFKDLARALGERIETSDRMMPRPGLLEPRFATLLPELVMDVTPAQLAVIAARALAPKPARTVALDHLHVPQVSVREQALLIVDRLRRDRSCTFRDLVADAADTMVIVARFLAVLELFKEAAIGFEQPDPLGPLVVRWTGSADGALDVGAEFDGEEEADGG